MPKKFSYLSICLLTCFSCYRNGDEEIKVEIVDEIKIVHNPSIGLWDKQGKNKITLVEVLQIGEEESDEADPNKTFHVITDIKVSSGGNIFIADAGNSRIQVFDKKGNFIRSISERGQGPGQFVSALLRLALDNDENLYVADFKANRIHKFNQNGNFINSYDCQIDWAIYGMVYARSGHFYLSFFETHKLFKAQNSHPKLLHKYASNWQKIASFFEPMNFAKFFEGAVPARQRTYRGIYTIGLLAIDQNENLYVSYFNPYEINVFSDSGKLLMKLFRKNDFMHPLNEYVQYFKQGTEVKINRPAGSVSILYYQPEEFILNTIQVPNSDGNRLKYTTTLDFFDRDGKLLSTVIHKNRKLTPFAYDSEGALYMLDNTTFDKVIKFALLLDE